MAGDTEHEALVLAEIERMVDDFEVLASKYSGVASYEGPSSDLREWEARVHEAREARGLARACLLDAIRVAVRGRKRAEGPGEACDRCGQPIVGAARLEAHGLVHRDPILCLVALQRRALDASSTHLEATRS